MPIDETQCCGGHTKKKEESGECCQVGEQQKAEQQTYEHSPMSLSLHALAKSNPTKAYRELEKMKEPKSVSQLLQEGMELERRLENE